MMIELNKEYTYQGICEAMNWNVTNGASKRAQIKEIETEYEFYHPINNKTKKEKKSYIFTSKSGTTYKSNHGGVREGAGRTFNLEEEFLTVLFYYIDYNYNNNSTFLTELYDEIYFNNDTICKFFGIYDQIYNLPERAQKNIDKIKYEEICTMLRARMKSIIFKKIDGVEGVALSKGIIVDVGTCRREMIQHDEYLMSYDMYEQCFLKENNYMHTGQVAKDGRWEEMIEYILHNFKRELGDAMNFRDIRKYNKITVSTVSHFREVVTQSEYEAAVDKINQYVVDSVIKSCIKKTQKTGDSIDAYNKIIDVCIRRRKNEE